MPRRGPWSLLLLLLAAGLWAARAHEPPADLELNLRWILARERAVSGGARPRVGVYADAGAWHVGARSLVAALEGAGVPCVVLERSRLTPAGMNGLEAVVVPGGWAPTQLEVFGPAGLDALRDFVEAGGRYVGVCAGAYAAAREVRWDTPAGAGPATAYPLGLFGGVARGPLASIAPWPERAPARLAWTAAARARGIEAADLEVLYFGGPRLVPDVPRQAAVLATYQDGGAAIVATRRGRGEVVLVAVHLERPASGDDDAPPPAGAGDLLRALVAP